MALASLIVLILFSSLCLSSDASKLPGLFVFGDSTVDTGNLKHQSSVSLLMSNSLPYGRDFVPPGPTGRASNGKLSVDFLADFLELPSPVDSVDANPGTNTQGVNFAAGGSGYLNSTGTILGTVSLNQQLNNFEKFLQSYSQIHGQAKASGDIANSLFVVSSGNNDMFNYLYNIVARLQYTTQSYNNLVLSQALSQIQRLYNLGARRILVTSLGPLGCTPGVLSILSSNGGCVEEVNSQVRSFNSALQASLDQLRSRLTGATLLYSDAYDLLLGAIQEPSIHGFRYGNDACCGLGRFHGSTPCSNSTSVCPVSDEHVFWDLVHPTQGMYRLVANSLISGPPSQISPMNLQQMVSQAGNV